MDQGKFLAGEDEIPPVRVQREGSSAYAFIRTLFDPETTGSANAVLGSMVIPPGQTEPMLPHAHQEYDESEYVVSGEGYVLLGPSRDQLTRYELKPGRAFFVPAGYPHCIGNTGEGEMKIAFSFYPAWVKGRSYREIATLLTDVKKLA
jgi:oxalate decarboxylase/phosphoglucose isomerase-like protein (cupin superfamily)